MKRISQNKFSAQNLFQETHEFTIFFQCCYLLSLLKSLSVGFAKQLESLINSCKKPKFFIQKSS